MNQSVAQELINKIEVIKIIKCFTILYIRTLKRVNMLEVNLKAKKNNNFTGNYLHDPSDAPVILQLGYLFLIFCNASFILNDLGVLS